MEVRREPPHHGLDRQRADSHQALAEQPPRRRLGSRHVDAVLEEEHPERIPAEADRLVPPESHLRVSVVERSEQPVDAHDGARARQPIDVAENHAGEGVEARAFDHQLQLGVSRLERVDQHPQVPAHHRKPIGQGLGHRGNGARHAKGARQQATVDDPGRTHATRSLAPPRRGKGRGAKRPFARALCRGRWP
jgi:hypothetical protein